MQNQLLAGDVSPLFEPKVSYAIEQLGALYLFGEALKPVAIQGLHHLGSGYRFDLKSSSLVPTTLQE